ncbi:17745_t:CDS:2 [Cetraspora pellucida]|uniref:17745_t:CDS:1 n=1 Tax=Cetraspora pellucida TaxID=1433469 RepID=A0A9N9AAH9_9GLOM|nr:17745_t:CDS:2 [Cetraspora pellucida]
MGHSSELLESLLLKVIAGMGGLEVRADFADVGDFLLEFTGLYQMDDSWVYVNRPGELCNEGTLEDYGFQKEGVMFLSLYMNIFVVMLDGKTIPFRVSECDTVKSVKQKIHDREGIPVHEQRLAYTTKELVDNEKKLADYNVQDNGTMYLALRLSGGC